MDTVVIVVIVAVALVVIAALAWTFMRKRRTEDLREGFGPEYEHTVEEYGDRRRAEAELQQRRKRVERLAIRPLQAGDRDRFAGEWRDTQARFVDSPEDAVRDADRLVGQVMEACGYPVGDFEQRSADVSVDHPQVVTNYRAAHAISLANDKGKASTEDLRQAMVHYRSLFDDLLETRQAARTEARR